MITSLSLLLVSFALDKKKTMMGLKKGLKMFKNIAIPFLNILIIVSLSLYIISPNLIAKYLGRGSGILGPIIASLVGAIAFIPGFMAYPIAGELLAKGASYATIATFIISLMVVGVVTLPLEIKYFGKRAAIVRNILSFLIAITTGLIIGIILK